MRVRNKTLTIGSFLLPGFLIYVGFMWYPTLRSFYLSTFHLPNLQTMTFVGLRNYVNLLTEPIFLQSLKNTVLFMTFNVPIQIGTAYVLAYLLYLGFKGYKAFRFIFFIPVVLLVAAVGVVAEYLFSPWLGPFTRFFEFFGLKYRNPFGNASIALFSVVMIDWWKWLGTKIMLFYAGFQNMSADVIEAATIDGASGVGLFFRIIIPLTWEILTMVIVLLIIGSLKVFGLVFIMTGGGPNHATEVLTIYLYNIAFSEFNFGAGSAVAVVLFVVTIIITIVMRRLFRRES